MLQILKDIAANRMPSVADLLKQASQSALASTSVKRDKTPMAGMVRDTRFGSRPAELKDAKKAPAAVPLVVDRESSQQPPDKNAGQPAPPQAREPAAAVASPDHAGRQERRWQAILSHGTEDGRGRRQTSSAAGSCSSRRSLTR